MSSDGQSGEHESLSCACLSLELPQVTPESLLEPGCPGHLPSPAAPGVPGRCAGNKSRRDIQGVSTPDLPSGFMGFETLLPTRGRRHGPSPPCFSRIFHSAAPPPAFQLPKDGTHCSLMSLGWSCCTPICGAPALLPAPGGCEPLNAARSLRLSGQTYLLWPSAISQNSPGPAHLCTPVSSQRLRYCRG